MPILCQSFRASWLEGVGEKKATNACSRANLSFCDLGCFLKSALLFFFCLPIQPLLIMFRSKAWRIKNPTFAMLAACRRRQLMPTFSHRTDPSFLPWVTSSLWNNPLSHSLSFHPWAFLSPPPHFVSLLNSSLRRPFPFGQNIQVKCGGLPEGVPPWGPG